VPIAPQILLPLESRRPDRFEDYVSGPNSGLVTALQELVQSSDACIFIRGAAGSGKTHLLNATCNLAQERGLQAFYMALGNAPASAAGGLSGLEEMDLVCFDDIDRVAGVTEWESSLFHLFNRMRERRRRLVISSTQPLSSIEFALPDLASRLAWGLRLQIEPLDDPGKKEVLEHKATALGIDLPADVAYYLLSRGSRNMANLVSNLEAVRIAALTAKRKITVPLAREVLATD
jgi:DnaA family protein